MSRMKSGPLDAMPLPPDCGASGLKMRLGVKIGPRRAVGVEALSRVAHPDRLTRRAIGIGHGEAADVGDPKARVRHARAAR